MMLLEIPQWFYSGILAAAGTGIISLLGVVWWFVQRTIKVVDRNTAAIESLDHTMLKMSGNFESYQATTDGKLNRIEELARIASRDVIEQNGELATVKTNVAKLDLRLGAIEVDHKYYHKK
jgi:hypothetical protein